MTGSSIKAIRSLQDRIDWAKGKRQHVENKKPLPDDYGIWIYVGPEDIMPTSHMTLGDLRKLIEEWR